jgi:HK97 family phage prohead protease
MLVNHDRNQVLGRTASGTLGLLADKKGLKFRCVLPDTQLARDVHTLVKRGDMSGCSFAFSTNDDTWTKDAGTGEDVRTINNVSGLFDTSVVTEPVYEDTSVAARGTKPGNDDAAWREKAEMKVRLGAVEL